MDSLKKNDVLTNQELMERFNVANSGGMRRSLKNNVLILVHNTLDSIYSDRWKEDILHYTGMGLQGDQSIEFAQNKTLRDSKSNGIQVLLFEVRKEKEYTYIGEVELNAEPYFEKQIDEAGKQREVVIFPLRLKN